MRNGFSVALALCIALCLLAGCGKDDPGETRVVVPRVIQFYPEDGATDVNLNTFVSVWFSEDMEASSLDSICVTGVPSHHVEYDAAAKKATVYLDTLLAPETGYEIYVSSYVMDDHGNNIAGDTTVGFTTGPFDCEHLSDMFEPNEDAASAPDLELHRTYALLTSCGEEERNDVFAFTLTDTVKVTARTEAAYVDTEYISWHMYFERDDGSFYHGIATSFRSNNPVPFHAHTFLPGRYYLHIWKTYIDHHEVAYHLTLDTSDPCEDDAYEDNDFIDQAVPVDPGTIEGLLGCKSDGDFFSTVLAAGQLLTVTATERTALGGNRMLEIFGPDHRYLTGHFDMVNPAVESWTAVEGGTYYFWILWLADGIVYDLDVEVSGP